MALAAREFGSVGSAKTVASTKQSKVMTKLTLIVELGSGFRKLNYNGISARINAMTYNARFKHVQVDVSHQHASTCATLWYSLW